MNDGLGRIHLAEAGVIVALFRISSSTESLIQARVRLLSPTVQPAASSRFN